MASNKTFIRNSFRFVGELVTAKDDSKVFSQQPIGDKWSKKVLNLGIKESDSNSVFVRIEGMIPNDKTYELSRRSEAVVDGKRETIKVPYVSRNSETIKKQVMQSGLLVVDLETDLEKKKEREHLRFELQNLKAKEDSDKDKIADVEAKYKELSDNYFTFVAEEDMIDKIKENLDTIKGKRVKMTGTYSKSTYNEKYYKNYTVTRFELVGDEKKADSDEYKIPSELVINPLYLFFDKDSVDNQLKEEKKIYINGYVKGQQKNDDGEYVDVFFPEQVVINCENFDLENEKHMGIIKFYENTFKTKKKTLQYMPIRCSVKEGAEEIEFSIDNLTDFQRMQIELGLKKLEDYAPKGGKYYGNRVSEIRFLGTRDDIDGFDEGAVDSDIETDEMIIVTSKKKEQTIEEVKKETPKKDESDALDSLFG